MGSVDQINQILHRRKIELKYFTWLKKVGLRILSRAALNSMKRKIRTETLEHFEKNIEEYVEESPKKTRGFSLKGISHSTKKYI